MSIFYFGFILPESCRIKKYTFLDKDPQKLHKKKINEEVN